LHFDVAFHHATPHGVVTAVHIPDSPDPVPDEVLARLPAAEAAHARTLKGYRQPSFVGGRLALRKAAEQLGQPLSGPCLPDSRGTPTLPTGLAGSISHKRDLAVGMVGVAHHGTLGVDLEDYGPPRLGIADAVLRPEELAVVEALPEARRWIALLVRFSIKESIYKAVDPYVRRYVAFHEAFVEPDLQGGARVALHLANGEGPFVVDARYEWLRGRLLTSVRLRRA
jgi:enterobactin synthetase component D